MLNPFRLWQFLTAIYLDALEQSLRPLLTFRWEDRHPHPKVGAGFKPAPTEAAPTDDVAAVAEYLAIRAAGDGHFAAGRAWTRAELIVGLDEFTTEQIDELIADPKLHVEFVTESGDRYFDDVPAWATETGTDTASPENADADAGAGFKPDTTEDVAAPEDAAPQDAATTEATEGE
ncbi:MAG: hypothetical protein LBO00_03860 [Zoogloeaceae bacterium]|jgi:hypothetical protein|nr:hypothetical protein [Zoogloeaceae bacterium]